MGESERYLERKFSKLTLGDDNNALMALVAVNLMLFVSFGVIQVIYYLSSSTDLAFQYEILRWVILPAKLQTLSVMPWTVFTYMFVHTGFMYTLITMVWLWVFGSILLTLAGNKNIIPIYIYGGFAGAIFFIAANYAVPGLRANLEYSSMFGGNAAIMAVAVATTTLAPKYRLFPMLNGGIPLWILTAVYILIDVTGANNMAVPLSHLGGGLAGFLFMVSLKRGNNWGTWMTEVYLWFINLFNPDKKKVKNLRNRDKLFYKTGGKMPYIKKPIITQEKVDQLLDKINQKGYDSLTEEEKLILKKAGETDF